MDPVLIGVIVATIGILGPPLTVAITALLGRAEMNIRVRASEATLRAELRKEISELDDEMVELRTQLRQERERNDELAELIESRNVRIIDLERKGEKYQEEILALQAQIVTLQAANNALIREVAELRRQV